MNLSNSFVSEKSSGRPLARFPENSNYEKAMLEVYDRFTSKEFSGNASLLADSESYGTLSMEVADVSVSFQPHHGP
jgi:hypothetical protein